MKELLTAAVNTFYHKNDDGEIKERFEVVLILTEPRYNLNNQGELNRNREVQEVRFFTSSVKKIAEILSSLEDTSVADEQLKTQKDKNNG